MQNLQVNDTAFIRTTSEEVFVLAIEGNEVIVRRPVMTQSGIEHKTERFYLAELDTIEGRAQREFADKQMLQNLFAQLNKGTNVEAPEKKLLTLAPQAN